MTGESAAYQRFIASLTLTEREWRDDTGYDLVALRACSEDERRRIEDLLIDRTVKDWRDLEALAALDSDRAGAEIRATLSSKDPVLRLSAARLLKDAPGRENELEAAVLNILDARQPHHVQMVGFDAAANLPTEKVKDALFRLALHGEGDGAARAAGLLLFLHRLSVAHYPMGERALLNRIASIDRGDKRKAFQELCDRLGVSAAKYK